ncbi:MAG: UvrD-helicase domain-containing protein [Limisphaerales bacterium]
MSDSGSILGSEMIRASAGSGKTYRLVNRYIRLLLMGQAPERIIALTFTRKAAGEFFEGILKRLAESVTDEAQRKKLSRDIELPELTAADYRLALRNLLERMPQLTLGTIDGFFHRVLGMFSLEYGLSGEFEIMDEFAAQRARLRALDQLFAAAEASEPDRQALLKSFELMSAGQQDRRIYDLLEQYLRDCHSMYHSAPEKRFWGQPETIWPQGNPWSVQPGNSALLVQAFRDALEAETGFDAVDARARKSWQKAADHLQKWEPGKDLLGSATLLKQAFSGLSQLESGDWTFQFYRKDFQPGAAFQQSLGALLRYCLAAEFNRLLERTRGVFAMLREYDGRYDGLIRRQGLLTFADLPVLLAPEEGRPVLGGTGPDRLALEYRLDGAFDHWLLDEFQDTSTAQWRVVENLVDEAVQDPDRSFFCVGDVKQSIYGWRGGDPHLFGRVETHYRHGAGHEFTVQSMDVSWRSAPAVLELVNAVFDQPALLREFDPVAAERWTDVWNEHQSAEAHADMAGHTMHLTVDHADDRYAVLAGLLRELQPTQRGMRCAVLVQTNKEAGRVVEYLREHVAELPVTGESATRPAIDNALGAAMVSLFKAAAHPGDRYAREHVAMTPLRELFEGEPHQWEPAMRQLQEQLYREGFEVAAREWSRRLVTDDFSSHRRRQFIELARQYDEAGLRDADEFIGFAESRDLNEGGVSGVVQVMTVHKAKGLTFDVTLVPDLEGSRLDARRSEALHAQADHYGDVEWVMDMPRQDLCAADDVLKGAVAAGRSKECFENLCRLYVALSRSRHGLYVISTRPKEKSPSPNFVHLLNESLGNAEEEWKGGGATAVKAFESGAWTWVEAFESDSAVAEHEQPRVQVKEGRDFPKLERRKPSEHEGALIQGSHLFDPQAKEAAQFGDAVHAVFEQIEWYTDEAEELLDGDAEAVAMVRTCLEESEIQEHFTADPEAVVWRERRFGVVLDGEFCSGVFDRVVLWPDRAEIVDFKTDMVRDAVDVEAAVARHQSQLDWYRRVLVLMTGLAPEQITCRLLFTRLPRLVTVP